LPLAVMSIVWWLATWLLATMEIGSNSHTHLIPRPVSGAQRFESAVIVGLGSYAAWKFVVGILLTLHLLNTYIYFGKQPFWVYVNATARTLLQPLSKIPLRLGKVDFAPVVGIGLAFLAAEQLETWLRWLYVRLPF
jgi:uncharacterized protein YggT (Ycf19 family)